MKPSRVLRQFKRADRGEDLLAERETWTNIIREAAKETGMSFESVQDAMRMRVRPRPAGVINEYRRQLALLDASRLP